VDIIGIQEVDNYTLRHPGDDQTKILSESTGMKFAQFGKMRDFQGGGYGIAILCKHPILDTKLFYYSKPSKNQKMRICGDPAPGDYCQGALAVLVNINGHKFWFVTTHIGLDGVQLNEVTQLFQQFISSTLKPSNYNIFVTGDFNTVPESTAIQYLSVRLQDMWRSNNNACGSGDGFTFDSASPFERIDYLFFYKIEHPIKCLNASVVNTQASDHRPVLFDLIF